MADTPTEMIEKARRAAAVRAQLALIELSGVGAPAIPIVRPGLPTVNPADPLAARRERARQFAIRIFDEDDPDMDKVAEIVGRIRNRLSTPNFPTQVASANDPLCTVRKFGGYALNNRPPVHLCDGFFAETQDVVRGELRTNPAEQRIRTLLHETAHLVGIGQPDGESYYVAYDGCPFREDGLGPNAADSWAHFIHAVSFQPLDLAAARLGRLGTTPAPTATDQTMYTVVPGDFLVKIATKFYGDGQKWRIIYNANKAVIGPNPDKIFPGQKLVIPPVP